MEEHPTSRERESELCDRTLRVCASDSWSRDVVRGLSGSRGEQIWTLRALSGRVSARGCGSRSGGTSEGVSPAKDDLSARLSCGVRGSRSGGPEAPRTALRPEDGGGLGWTL